MSKFRSTDHADRTGNVRPQETDVSPSREATGFERTLSYAAAIIAITSFLAMMALLIAPLVGVDFSNAPTGLWSVVMTIAYYGFPLAFICVVVLIISNVMRNRRRNNEH